MLSSTRRTAAMALRGLPPFTDCQRAQRTKPLSSQTVYSPITTPRRLRSLHIILVIEARRSSTDTRPRTRWSRAATADEVHDGQRTTRSSTAITRRQERRGSICTVRFVRHGTEGCTSRTNWHRAAPLSTKSPIGHANPPSGP